MGKKQGLFTTHLTSPNPEFDDKVRKTAPGMAHFSGTGPVGMTCRECVFMVKEGAVKRCKRFQIKGPPIKTNPDACKYFEGKTGRVS